MLFPVVVPGDLYLGGNNKIAPFFDSKNWCYFSLLHHSAIAKPDRHSTILLSSCWFFPAWTTERFTMVPRAVPPFLSDFAAPVSAPARKQPIRGGRSQSYTAASYTEWSDPFHSLLNGLTTFIPQYTCPSFKSSEINSVQPFASAVASKRES